MAGGGDFLLLTLFREDKSTCFALLVHAVWSERCMACPVSPGAVQTGEKIPPSTPRADNLGHALSGAGSAVVTVTRVLLCECGDVAEQRQNAAEFLHSRRVIDCFIE